jgi:hypothetical protein
LGVYGYTVTRKLSVFVRFRAPLQATAWESEDGIPINGGKWQSALYDKAFLIVKVDQRNTIYKLCVPCSIMILVKSTSFSYEQLFQTMRLLRLPTTSRTII